MKTEFKKFLFQKRYFVHDYDIIDEEESFCSLVTLEHEFGIRLTNMKFAANKEMIRLAADGLGHYVPEPFYRGFPQSVRELTSQELLFDQLLHYTQTYGLGFFHNAGHSSFEENLERVAFNEEVTMKEYTVLTEAEALDKLIEFLHAMLESTRPLNADSYLLVVQALNEYGDVVLPEKIGCKQTVAMMLYNTKDIRFAKYLNLSDVIKLVEYINYEKYGNENLKKLSFSNQDRKFVEKVINHKFQTGKNETHHCFEKRKIWCGLLHHIHFRPANAEAKDFACRIRNGKNYSVYSVFERLMAEHSIESAALVLKNFKGDSAVVRNLNYMLSRCETEKEVKGVLGCLK